MGEYLLQGYVHQWHGLRNYVKLYGKNGEVVDGWWIRQDPLHHSHPQTNQVQGNYHSPLDMEERDCRDGVYGLCGEGCGSSIAACAGMYGGGRFLGIVGPPKMRCR